MTIYPDDQVGVRRLLIEGVEIHFVAKIENGIITAVDDLNSNNNMRAICKKITVEGFDLKYITTVLSNDFDYSYGGYGLEIGREYLILGIAIRSNSSCLYYLVDTNSKPDWFPYLLFNITDNTIPNGWYVKVDNNISEIAALFGFYELCNDDDYYIKLIDRDEVAMRQYFKRKKEMEDNIENQDM